MGDLKQQRPAGAEVKRSIGIDPADYGASSEQPVIGNGNPQWTKRKTEPVCVVLKNDLYAHTKFCESF